MSSAEDLGVARDQDNTEADLTASSTAVERAALYKLVTHSNTSRLGKSVSEIYHRAPSEVILGTVSTKVIYSKVPDYISGTSCAVIV